MRRFGMLLFRSFAALALAGALLVVPTPRDAGAILPGGDGPIAYARSFGVAPEVYVMNPDGSGLTNLTNSSEPDFDPAWSRDGTRIAFTREVDGDMEVFVMNADGSGQTRLTDRPGEDMDPTWSPDGSKLAFTRQLNSEEDGLDREVFMMNADGTGQVNLTNEPGHEDRDPSWSPVGNQIAFSSSRDGDYEIYSTSPGGGEPNQLTDNSPAGDFQPAYSPDGTKIAWQGASTEIWVMNANGGSEDMLTDSSSAAADPAWSPDSTQIAYKLTVGDGEIYVMNANGTDQTAITDNVNQDSDPSWGPPCWQPYSDVPTWVDQAVAWTFCERYMTGFANNTFRPDDNMTRAQVARLEYRIAGSPDVSGLPDHGLEDVPPWVEDPVKWLVDGSYMTGYDDDTFRPDLPITRAQVTRLKYRVAGSPPGAPDNAFSDVPPWVEDAVDWIVDPANTPPYATGFANGTYKPDLSITRAQTTRMSCRIVGTVAC